MGRQQRLIEIALREMVIAAVQEGVITPNGISQYLISNGWKYDMPTRPTLIKMLAENNVAWKGFWYKRQPDTDME